MITKIKTLILVFILLLGLGSTSFGQTQEKIPKPTSEEKTISLNSSSNQDKAIGQRLRDIFTQIDSLKKVEVKVNNGVVTLSGEVPSKSASEQAAQLTQQVDGVVEVENNLVLFKQLDKQISVSLERVKAMGNDFLSRLPVFGIALLVILLFFFLGKAITSWKGLFKRITPNPFIATIIQSLVRAGFLFTGLLLAFEILDATAFLGTLLGAAGLAGLAVGFALKETVENYLASILLSLRQPFAPNDHVKILEHEGIVVQLNTRATILMTLDGNHLRIPNSQVFKGVILNFSRNPQRRLGFQIGVDTQLKLFKVQKLGETTLLNHQAILRDPPPTVWVQEMGDSNVVLQFFAWMDQREFDFFKVRSEAIRIVKKAFDESGIIMPEPIYNVKLQGISSEKPIGELATKDKKIKIEKELLGATEDAEPDISVEDHLDAQIAEERRGKGADDLLDENKPQEY